MNTPFSTVPFGLKVLAQVATANHKRGMQNEEEEMVNEQNICKQ